MPDGTTNHLLALFAGKQRGFGFIGGDGNYHPIKQPGSPVDQIQVAIGHGIETPWIDDCSHIITYQGLRRWIRRRSPLQLKPSQPEGHHIRVFTAMANEFGM
jgi:hypothetical protein